MIQSMTGYGKATVVYENKKITAEIKSLNSKSIDIGTRISPLYREKEMEIRSIITAELERGKVDFYLGFENENEKKSLSINTQVFESYLNQIKNIAEKNNLPLPPDWFTTILKMPDIFAKNDQEELANQEWEVVKNVIYKSIENLVCFRKQEGASIKKNFLVNLDNICNMLNSVSIFEKERVDKIKERIKDSLTQFTDFNYDKNRFEQELIYYIEKLDISEEKQRLSNHLSYFAKTLENGKGQGKQLGFIAQEMSREINTLGSKSNHAKMQNLVVKMKNELEQIREQVFNVM